MEVATTMYADIDANERKFIQVLLEPADNIRPAIRTNIIDLTDHTTRVDRYHFLLRSLHVDVTPLPNPPRRTLAEAIALLPENSPAVMDADFAKDVEAAIASHRESLNSAWE